MELGEKNQITEKNLKLKEKIYRIFQNISRYFFSLALNYPAIKKVRLFCAFPTRQSGKSESWK